MSKKVLSLVLVCAMMLALGAIATAESNSQIVTGPTTRVWQDGFGFHCCGAVDVEYTGSNPAVINAIKGIKKPVDKNNPMIVAKGDQKDYFGTKTYPITLERVGDTTMWKLMTGDDIVCKHCGRTDWVTYSNNSGVITGKNIQVVHPPIDNTVPDEPELHASLSFEKKVNGVGILGWLADSIWAADAMDIIEGLEFYLTGVDNDYEYGPVTPDIGTGRVVFPDVEPGVYVLSEVVTGAAAGKFAAIDPITIEISEGDDVFKVLDGTAGSYGIGSVAIGNIENVRITWEKALPMIALRTDGTTIGQAIGGYYPWGTDVEPYNMTSYYLEAQIGGKWVPSFCGRLFTNDPAGAYVEDSSYLTPAQREKIIAAIDYVNDAFGLDLVSPLTFGTTIDEVGYAIAQILVWRIIHTDTIEAIVPAGWLMYAAQLTYYDEGGFADYIDWIIDNCVNIYNAKDAGAYRVTNVLSFTNENELAQPQIVPVFGGGFYINNEPAELHASLSFEKKVEGENIVEWLLDSKWAADAADILDGLEFTLTGVDNGNVYGPVTPDLMTGLVAFNDIVPGTYILSEQIKGAAVGKFFAIEGITLLISGGEDKYTAIGGAVTSSGSGESISDGDFFTIVNGYGSGYVLGYPGLNNSGDIFPIAVTSVPGGVVYPSFCAHGGSRAFAGQSGLGCAGYVVASPSLMAVNEPQAKDIIDFVKAYNYIEDNYGDLNDFRPVTQMVTWILLGQIDISSDAFANINWGTIEAGTAAVKGVADAEAIVRDIIANYEGYVGGGNITGVMYMVCEHHHSTGDCQPQIVPFYGAFYVENKLAQ